MFDANSPYKGKITAYDSPIYIADAALYLMKTKPDLGIKNPYALDDKQFEAAVDLLKQQKRRTSASTGRTTPRRSRPSRAADSVLGTTWQVIANLVDRPTKADRSTPSCRRRARPAGPTPGWSSPRPSTRTACTSG